MQYSISSIAKGTALIWDVFKHKRSLSTQIVAFFYPPRRVNAPRKTHASRVPGCLVRELFMAFWGNIWMNAQKTALKYGYSTENRFNRSELLPCRFSLTIYTKLEAWAPHHEVRIFNNTEPNLPLNERPCAHKIVLDRHMSRFTWCQGLKCETLYPWKT